MLDFSTSIDIEAPPEVVFAHLASAERMVAWMGQHADLDPSPGGGFVVDVNRADITTEVARAYYANWKNGSASFDAARLRQILAIDLRFEGPITGRRTGVESFLHGLEDFVRSLKAVHVLQQIYADHEAAALYDCDLGVSSGTLRFAEFLRVEHDRIQSIRLVYDPMEFRRLTA
jgi:hypothetical protein